MEKTPLQRFIAAALELAPEKRDHYDKLIMKRTGTTGKLIYDIERGKSLNPGRKTLDLVADALNQPQELVYAAADGEDVDPVDRWSASGGEVMSDADRYGFVEIREWDIKYGMGGGTYLELPVKQTRHVISRELLRKYTDAPPEKIVIATGIGDSMVPTIFDADALIIDLSDNRLMLSDKIWAIAYGETGMVKRLRAMPDGGVKIMSDNQSVPPDTAYDGELAIVGRVAGIIRKT